MDEFNIYNELGDDAYVNQDNINKAQQKGADIGQQVGAGIGKAASFIPGAGPMIEKTLGPLASALGGWIAKRRAEKHEEFLRDSRVSQMGSIVDYRISKARENTLLNQAI